MALLVRRVCQVVEPLWRGCSLETSRIPFGSPSVATRAWGLTARPLERGCQDSVALGVIARVVR
eukprot:14814418-Alexandrium_andersonii.AAC.1